MALRARAQHQQCVRQNREARAIPGQCGAFSLQSGASTLVRYRIFGKRIHHKISNSAMTAAIPKMAPATSGIPIVPGNLRLWRIAISFARQRR